MAMAIINNGEMKISLDAKWHGENQCNHKWHGSIEMWHHQ
jgi:hypothetical protein